METKHLSRREKIKQGICIVPGCDNPAVVCGDCRVCYRNVMRLIAKKPTPEARKAERKRLEKKGLVLPSRRGETKRSRVAIEASK